MNKRTAMRGIHLVSSVAIGTFVYSPWRDYSVFVSGMQLFILPVVTLSGIWMWKGNELQRLLTSLQNRLIAAPIDK
jgi:hypothetical protein